MERTRVTTERPDLRINFGSLPPDRADAALSALGRVEAALFEMRDALADDQGSWHSEGVTLDVYPSGQVSLYGYVERGDIAFTLELAPCDFYKPLQNDRAFESWDVDGAVWATPDRHGNVAVAEVRSHRFHDPETACAALIEVCTALRVLARPRTNEAWLTTLNDQAS